MTESEPRTRRFRPEPGWLTLVLLSLLALLVGWSIDAAKWVPGPESLTDFLPWSAVGGVIAGFAVAVTRLRRLTAHLVGAIPPRSSSRSSSDVMVVPDEGNFFALYRAASDQPAPRSSTWSSPAVGRPTSSATSCSSWPS
jgi:hypothetical protein